MSFLAVVVTAAVVAAVTAIGTVAFLEVYLQRRANETIGEHEQLDRPGSHRAGGAGPKGSDRH